MMYIIVFQLFVVSNKMKFNSSNLIHPFALACEWFDGNLEFKITLNDMLKKQIIIIHVDIIVQIHINMVPSMTISVLKKACN